MNVNEHKDNFTFGDFTREELNSLIQKSNTTTTTTTTTTRILTTTTTINTRSDQSSIEFPWKNDKFHELNNDLTDIEFGFNLPKLELLSQSSSSSSTNNNHLILPKQSSSYFNNRMDSSQLQTQRRNKKQRPPDYYKKEYVEILKLENENNAQQISVSTNLIKNNNENVQEKLNNLIIDDQEKTIKKEINNNIEESNTQLESTNEIVSNKSELTSLPLQQQPPPPPTTTNTQSSSSSSSATTKSWANLFKAGSTISHSATTTSTTSQELKHNPQLTKQQTSQSSLNKTQLENLTSQQQPQRDNHVRRTSSSSSFSQSMSQQSPQNITESSQEILKSLGQIFKSSELKHSAPALQPRGLINKSNWCYINATLQALLGCPPFYNLIKQIFNKTKNSAAANSNIPCLAALGRYVFEFKTMVRPSTSDSQQKRSKDLVIGEPFDIEYFYDILSTLKTDLATRGRQEDAQEFLSFLLNRLHEEAIKCLESIDSLTTQQSVIENETQVTPKLNGISSSSKNQAAQLEDNDEWQEVGKKNRAFITRRTEFKQSPISDIFCGQFRSALSQPNSREKESISLEPFFTLPLEIQPDKVRTVNDALEHFVQKEEIFDFIHPETKQKINAYKRICFEDLPPVLIIYLKCFIYDKNGGIQKLLKRIEYQIELEINKDLISSNQRSKLKDKKRIYKLFAVEYHQGDKATGGHYITDVYHPGIIGWVRYDDSQVRVVTNNQVLKSDDKKLIPYLLYYRRSDLI